ncbi:FadR/GntR family transcriptional regulator [Cohnella nanjingensis]|uniref:FadR family transcriptional regulator n=1 Tax=Cohnella nanjingensis TaxID=1387779 RepID=A0A7X0VI67_9BACL|nr:FadR/GntR family transcriptional regulator [Cohnella nanjingensis]MBB6673359.1 FadR family transcriptional regulator [Cohnella nanjingensis]
MKKLAHEAVIERVRQKIDAGEWKPGDRLPTMPKLAEAFGLSVTAVREALRVLETQRIVSIEHGRGIFLRHDPALAEDPAGKLREFTSSSLLQLLEARLVLEPELAAFCAERATVQQAGQIRRLADRMAEEMRDGGDHFSTDVLFHQAIAEAANNPLLAQMLEVVSDLSAKGRRETDRLPHMNVKAQHYHTLIAIAIEERQPEQARALMKAHIRDMIAAVKQAWS